MTRHLQRGRDFPAVGDHHRPGATVDPGSATNSPFYAEEGSNAFTVVALNVTIERSTVTGARADGILSAGNQSTPKNNLAEDNGGTSTSTEPRGRPFPVRVVVAFNAIHGNQYGIFAAGPVTVVGKHFNFFFANGSPFGSTPVYAG